MAESRVFGVERGRGEREGRKEGRKEREREREREKKRKRERGGKIVTLIVLS
jgi:hypothetical protein